VLLSQLLHSYIARGVGWPLGWDDNLWSAKRPRSLPEQLGIGVKSYLIEEEDLGGKKCPHAETRRFAPLSRVIELKRCAGPGVGHGRISTVTGRIGIRVLGDDGRSLEVPARRR